MIRPLSDESHEHLWRLCETLVTSSGARAAMICDAETGLVLVSMGDAAGQGAPTGVEALGPGERLVRGESGQVYGVDVPGGAMLAVLHEVEALERVREAAGRMLAEAGEVLRDELARQAEALERLRMARELAGLPGDHDHAPAPEAGPAGTPAKKAVRRKTARRKPAPTGPARRRKAAAAKKPAAKKGGPKKAAPKKRAAKASRRR